MGWEKGKPRNRRLPQEQQQKTENEQLPGNTESVTTAPTPSPKTEPEGVAAPWDTTIYSNEHEPRNVKAGEIVPDGWTMEPRTLKVRWKNKIDGSWYSEPVEA